MKDFLPVSVEDMRARGWQQCDFICVTGDAYVDHPSFGAALIARLLEAEGYNVGVIPRPDWRSPDDFKRLGRPRLAFLITAGNIDSMVSNYTAARKPRRDDAYAPGGKGGGRPDRASIVYAVRAREACKGVPVILGGLEASLRRLSHYDYWDDKVRRSVLLDAKADILVYGMGERQICEIARRLASAREAQTAADLKGIPGTVYASSELPEGWNGILLPQFEDAAAQPETFAASFKTQYLHTDPLRSLPLAEPYGAGSQRRFVIQNPPAMILSREEFDRVYELPYARAYHPSYEAEGGVPAIAEVRFSLTSCRGCFGSCSFCSLTFHQGRIVQGRGRESLIREAQMLTGEPDFKGYIHDVGGPTANFRGPACAKQTSAGSCAGRECLFPKPCKNLRADHSDYLALLRELRALPKVKKFLSDRASVLIIFLPTQAAVFLTSCASITFPASLKSRRNTYRKKSWPPWESPAAASTRSLKKNTLPSTPAWAKSSTLCPILFPAIREAILARRSSWPNTFAENILSPNRFRIFIPRREPSRPACITRASTPGQAKKSLSRSLRMKKPCSAPSCSTKTRKTHASCAKPSHWREGAILSGVGRNA
jgi:uncharacterized radical SAM protein YgiQ